jgi:hypothetical protein
LGSVISVVGNGDAGSPPAANHVDGEMDDAEVPASMPSASIGGPGKKTLKQSKASFVNSHKTNIAEEMKNDDAAKFYKKGEFKVHGSTTGEFY